MAELNLEQAKALVDKMPEWYNEFVIAEQKRNETEGHLFNVFALWNRLSGIGETLHSRLLHFLLSDDPMHGQNDKFLMKFLEMAGIENPQEGTWYVTTEIGRVDVMLERKNPRSVIIIENKSNKAADQSHQLYRYWYENMYTPERKEYDNSHYKIIYLSPGADKKFDDQTCCKPRKEWFPQKDRCNYDKLPDRIPVEPVVWHFNDDIQKWLGQCIEALPETNQPLRNYLNQYKEYWKNYNIMNESLTKAMALFDKPEKWAAFCVLCDKRDEMLKIWLSELVDKLQKKLDTEKWIVKFEQPYNTAIKFYLKEYGDRALSIVWYMDNPRIALWIDPNKYNADRVQSLLKVNLHLDDSYYTSNDWDLYSKEIKESRGDRYSVLYTLSHNDAKWEEIFETYIHKFVSEQTSVFEDICRPAESQHL